jgi:hypothetical protein
MIDFERPRLKEFHHWIAQEIPCEEQARTELQSFPLPSVLIRYLNWRDRLVPARPRAVMTWDTFLGDNRTLDHWPAVTAHAARIAAGQDLTPYLSQDIARSGYVRSRASSNKRPGVEWRDKDYALNAYGFHHLHLSDTILPSGWARRTKELLYVSFDRDSAFFLMVGDHKSFDDGTLAQAVAKTRAASRSSILGLATPGRKSADHSERNRLQRHGFTTTMTVGDKVVFGAIISTAGTSTFHSVHVTKIMRAIEAPELRADDAEFRRELFELAPQECPAVPDFVWRMHNCDVGLLERTTGTFFTVLPWIR